MSSLPRRAGEKHSPDAPSFYTGITLESLGPRVRTVRERRIVAMDAENRLDLLVAMLRDLSRSGDSVGSVNTFLRGIRQLNGDYALVSISRRNVPEGCYRVARFVHQDGVALVGSADPGASTDAKQGGFIGGLIAADKQQVFENINVKGDPAVGDALAPYRTILAVPVFDDGEALNWVLYMRDRPRGFTAAEVEDLTLQANLMGGLTTAKQHARNLVIKQEELEDALRNLRETQNRLIAQEKLASLGALTAGIAHEIRNPLNFVTNFASLSGESVAALQELLHDAIQTLPGDRRTEAEELLQDLRSNAAKIREHGERANAIVKGMLGHANHRRGESAETDVNALVEEYSKLAYYGRGNGKGRPDIDWSTDYADGLPRIHTVPQDLGRAILNVVTNACQAVEARRAELDCNYRPAVRVQTLGGNGHIEIRVRDNGMGMDRNTAERAFDPFFTTKAAGMGTGLGLSIVHTIVVQEHHGSVEVDSTPGEYTEIRLKLPTTLGAFGTIQRA
jgi:signal transduction histidine kinase